MEKANQQACSQKKHSPKEYNDFRPGALTPVVMKYTGKMMVSKLRSEVDDAVHMVNKHLENPRDYARLLFNFSSTLQPRTLLLNQLCVKALTPTQCVRVNRTVSEPMTISTGAPQECVSSPVLFTLLDFPMTLRSNPNQKGSKKIRYRVPVSRHHNFKHYFVPLSIKALNAT